WRLKLPQEYENRSEFFNTSLRLERLNYNDSGHYQLDIYNFSGTLIRKVKMKLDIQDMISESRLSSVCLSHGEIVVTCNATGDRLRFSWTLNSQILNRTVASGENYSSVSTLKADVPGVLTCMVQNEVSSSNSTITLPTCPVFSTLLSFIIVTVAIALSFGTLLLLITVIMCIKRRCIKLHIQLHIQSPTTGLYTEVLFNVMK
ncbi:hypothetical protein DPEC_G00236800, partial [Dallia pectoralis]